MIWGCDGKWNVSSAKQLHPHSLGQFNFSMINIHFDSRYHILLTVFSSVMVERKKQSRGEGGKKGEGRNKGRKREKKQLRS